MHPLLRAGMAIITSRLTPWLLLATTIAVVGFAPSVPRLREALAPPEVQSLSARMRDRGREYVQGLALIVSGERVMGDNLLVSSTDRLGVLAGECLRTEGCDMDVVASALARAVEERNVPKAPASRARVTSARADARLTIPLNTPVKRALGDWLTWNRPQLVDTYENYLFLRDQLAPIYADAELPEALLFGLLAQETGGKVHAYSRAGAAGPLQFMPITARRFGLHLVSGFDMRLDPVAATRASASYLTALLTRFGGDLPKALAAYNLGENKLASLQRGLGVDTFWDVKLARALPTETRLYVPGVLAAAWIFMHAADHGLVPAPETGLTEITLRDDISIGELTICLGSELNHAGWFRTFRNLNPRLSGNERIDAGAPLRMPSMLVPLYVERCAGDSPWLARARDLYEARDETPEGLEYALQERD
jgi:membrane-bound lytic murein transglycosylase D